MAASTVRTFAAGFGDLINELPFARDVADRHETEHHESHVESIDVAGELAAMSTIYDEPFGDSSNIPTALISRQARQHVKVVLSGDGGDELFGGYAWYEPAMAATGVGEVDAWAEHVARTGPIAADRTGLWAGRGQPSAVEPLRQRFASPATTGMDVATHFDVSCYLAGDILVKVDRAAMSCGLETRAPFLDADLAEFVLGLPWQMRFGIRQRASASTARLNESRSGGVGVMTIKSARPTLRFSPDGRIVLRSVDSTTEVCTAPRAGTHGGSGEGLKSLLRESCGDLWPASVRSRNKQGFGAPVKSWLLRPDVEAAWRRVKASGGPLAALLPGVNDSTTVDALRPQRKWSLLCLGMWLEGREGCLAELQ